MNVEMWSLLKAGNIKTVITLISALTVFAIDSVLKNLMNTIMFIKQKPYLKIV